MKKQIAKIVNSLDRFLHLNFDFLNVGKPGEFNKNYEWIYKYLEEENSDLSQKTFIEVGSRDVLDSLDIISKYDFLKAFAFEASHSGINESIKNLRQNIKFSRKIVLYPFALGEENSISNFYEPTFIPKTHIRSNIGSSSIFGKDDEHNHQYEVPIMRLDDISIDFENNYLIIMDCEGSEYPILKGATSAIKYSKYICLETSYVSKSGNCYDIKELLEKNGYQLIDCDWPGTLKGKLPIEIEVKNDQFCIIFENINYHG